MWHARFLRRLVLLVAFPLAMLVAGAPAALAASDYELQTRETIGKLLQANELLASGKTEDARAVVLGMSQSIQTLTQIAQKYRQIANREHDRCLIRIGELDLKTNQLFVEQTEINKKIDDLTASISNAQTTGSLADTEVKRLNGMLDDTLKRMREREARLEELRKWWWVPGYGQYLAIRTLADNDIGNYDRAVKDFEDQNLRLAQNRESLKQARTLASDLVAERTRANLLNDQLSQMRTVSQARLNGLNGIAVFLTDADVFWGLAQNLLEVNGDMFIRKMNVIQNVLIRDVNAPSLKSPAASTAQSFQKKLIEFADSLDKQSNFLIENTTDFCGGPALALNAAVTPTSQCKIEQITAYYEIVDPKTCSFRYLNPPGCPPPAKNPDLGEASLERGRGRGAWTRSPGQNWIGQPSTSPCVIAGTIYYGKLSGPDQCEAVCQGDAACTVWSFNTNNGFMPNSVNQCWGGTQALAPNKRDWSGFVSGGMR
ncbi:MAG: hypothetical protein ABIU18_06765 [Novosphingobium sp.]